jgi:hypothetical protein
VAAVDLAGGSVTGAKIADDVVTGADVQEGSLGIVPNAGQLDGLDSTQFGRSGGRAFSVTFTETSPLSLTVPGYGDFYLYCDDNNTSGVPGDDLVTCGYGHSLGTGALTGMRAFFSNSPVNADPNIYLFNSDANAFAEIAQEDDRVQVEQYLRSRNGDRAIRVSAWGYEDPAGTTNCIGMIETQIVR